MLNGGFTGKIDDKGRIKIPSEFRREIVERHGDGDLYVTSTEGLCAQVFPKRVWEDINDRLSKVPPSKGAVQKYRQFTNYYGQHASMDAQGRVLLHPRLREDTGIDGEVVILGQHSHLEIWSHKKFRDEQLRNRLTPEEKDYLAGLGI